MNFTHHSANQPLNVPTVVSEVIARRRGRQAARDRFSPVEGSLEPQWPLSLVQIDHTLVDVIVVDSVTRVPIQRPWLTLAIDVYSRCVLGFHLSLEPPSATGVALCIAHSVLSKLPWLAERKIEAEWAQEGLIEHLHLDNAKELRYRDRVPTCAPDPIVVVSPTADPMLSVRCSW